jgi:hypothetical protein
MEVDMAGIWLMGRRIAALAGALALAGLGLVAVSPPAGAISVSNEAEFRNAWTDPNESQIDLANDIDLTCTNMVTGNGVSVRTSTTTAITVDGHGHTLRQTCTTGTNNGVLRHNGTAAVALQNITITGGRAERGGGYRATESADITVTNSTITGNIASADVVADGGAIRAFTGNVTVTNSTISGNTATTDFEPEGGAISDEKGNVTVTNSTVSGNAAVGNQAVGGAIFDKNGNVTVINSTITENRATAITPGTAAHQGGIFALTGNVALVYATIASNAATIEGANIRTGDFGNLSSFGSVVALPQGGAANCDVVSASSNGFNFSDDTSCGFTDGTDQQNAGDPGLGALADNGGSTQTRLPQANSPLIDAVPNTSCQDDGASGITTDQRGFPRPEVTGGLCDIGAVEVERPPGPTPTPPGPTPPPAPPQPPESTAAAPIQGVVRFTG